VSSADRICAAADLILSGAKDGQQQVMMHLPPVVIDSMMNYIICCVPLLLQHWSDIRAL
jgi:hypothetical protein